MLKLQRKTEAILPMAGFFSKSRGSRDGPCFFLKKDFVTQRLQALNGHRAFLDLLL